MCLLLTFIFRVPKKKKSKNLNQDNCLRYVEHIISKYITVNWIFPAALIPHNSEFDWKVIINLIKITEEDSVNT